MVNQKTYLAVISVAVVALTASQTGILGDLGLSAADGPDMDQPTQGDDDSVASLSFKVSDAQSDSTNYLASSYYVYNSDGLQVASGMTGTDSFTTVNDLSENADYTVHVVDDDGADSDEVYHASTEVTTGEAVERFVVDADRQGSIVTSISEDSGTEDDGTLELNAGKTGSATLEIEENTGDAVINDPAVFVKTNDSAVVSEVTVEGASEITEDVDRLSGYADGYDLGVDQIVDFGQENVDIRVEMDESASGTAQVTAAVVDGDEYQTDTDTWEFGYEDDSDNDIRLADATQTFTATTP